MSGVRAAAIFRIGSHGGDEVSRHVDFGNDFDVLLLGVSHDVFDFFLGVEVGTVGLVNPILRTSVHVGEA